MLRVFLALILFLGLFLSGRTVMCQTCDGIVGLIPDSSFDITSKDIISRLKKFRIENGQYSSTSGDLRFSDIGLDPKKWKNKPIDGILYNPQGNQLLVRPARGYVFFVNDLKGVTRIISHILGWSLIYDIKSAQWYLYEIKSDNLMNIETFCLKKDTPYDPSRYKRYRKIE